MKKVVIIILLVFQCVVTGYSQDNKYDDNWESLKNYTVPEWYEDAKLGFSYNFV